MDFSKALFLLTIVIALFLNNSEAGNKVAKETVNLAGKALKGSGTKIGTATGVGVAVNTTVNYKTKNGESSKEPGSPKKGKH